MSRTKFYQGARARVTDTLINTVLDRLKQAGSMGLTRTRGAESVGGDDRLFRLCVQHIREQGLACVVSDVLNPQGHSVYRLALDEEEFMAWMRRENSRIDKLVRATDGMRRAFERGPREVLKPQAGLF